MDTSIVVIIVSVGFLLYGFYKIWRIVQLSRKISASKAWPAVEAEVVSKNVREHWTQKGGKSYFPEITTRYSIMGQSYEKTATLPGIFSRNSAEQALGKIGSTMEVRYNPENPAEHVTGQDKVNITDIILVVAMLGLAIFLLSSYLF